MCGGLSKAFGRARRTGAKPRPTGGRGSKVAEELTIPGDPPITVLLRPSAQARRLSLRVSRLDGRVTLTLPRGAGRREAEAFARDKAGWIRRHLASQPGELRPMPGESIPFRGTAHAVVAAATRAVRLGEGVIEVPRSRAETTPARLAAFLKHHARLELAEATHRHAARLGLAHGAITLRDTRSRWGSCAHGGALSYSWRLIMAPPEVLDYVAAHEVAHLAEMNHSPAFWATVARTLPGFGEPRLWLKRHGAELHRYRFRD